MKIGEFIKVLSAIDEINEVIDEIKEEHGAPGVYVSEEGKALNDLKPLLKDLIGKFLHHAEQYLK